ncbi:ribosome assembly factor SBDS [Candidatus Woesearchaeota archaeon]|nr:MAG: ribosome assembly factor SBDS [Candidatus Woesearchaeota archaeon]
MVKGQGLIDQRQNVYLNLARLKKAGDVFEISIDPDAAIKYKEKGEIDIRDILTAQKIFSDAKRGMLASENRLKSVFGTIDVLQVAKKILDEGEIQLTEEYRRSLIERKRKRIVEIIHRNGIDPKTKLPHPVKRIENAFEEAKIKIDNYKTAEDQINDIIKKIRPVLPISFERKRFRVVIPAVYAGKVYRNLKQSGELSDEDWKNDGSFECVIEMPAGLVGEFFDKINDATHGESLIEEIEE